MLKLNKKHGFTLVEVLTTLMIIGVVAALVIPQVNIAYQRATLYAQFMKTYNSLVKAVAISSMSNGEVGVWSYNTDNTDVIISNYIKPYVRLLNEKEIPPYTLMDLNTNTIDALNNYISEKTGGGRTQYTFADGSSILVREITPEGPVIMADVNGDRTPNMIGRDVYFFLLRERDNQVVPLVDAGVNFKNCGGVPDSGVLPGEGCAARLIQENGMKY